MTVSSITPVNNYAGNGSTTTFDFDFLIEAEDELKVQVTNNQGVQSTLTLNTDYTIHEVGNESGSYITYPKTGSTHTVLASDEVITLSLDLDIEQEKEIKNSSKLNLVTLEWCLDYLTRLIQILNRQMERSIKVQESTSIDTETLVNNINNVSADLPVIEAVNANQTNINAVNNNKTNIDTVAANNTNITTVAGIKDEIVAVEGISTEVVSVDSNKTNINTVAGSISNVNTVGTNISNVNSVAGDITNIDAVNANKTNIDTVAGISANVTSVAGVASDIPEVADHTANIDTAATNISNINTCASNITDIQNASSNAALSKQYAIGYPTEPTEGSAKYWASQAAQGQIQSDWDQTDTTKKDYIKNKPTKLSDFSDDTATNPIDKADTLTGLTATVNELNLLDGVTADTNEINYLDGVTSAIQTQIDKKANIICYLDRDFEYKHPKYMTADKSTITILAGTAIRLKNNTYFYTASDRTYSIDSILDTGSVSNGKDYYFYLNNDSELIASLSETNPLDYSADEVVRIGGAHTMCVTLGNDTPSLLADSFWTEHPYKGYSINDFMPNTIWTPAFKSGAKTGNKGQALIEHYGLDKFWGDIYLQSGTGTATASDYSGTITNNRQCILHQWDMNQVGKKFPTDQQFTIMSEGSNQQTNIAGSAIPSGRLTGGYKDTAGKWMISGFGIWCCCGYLWQWGDEIAPVGGSGWSAYGDTRRGASYGMPYVLLFGGDYATSSNCGSWSRVSHSTRTYAYVNGGGRGVSLHIERQHK